MLLADELFCIGHDDRTGRCRLRPRVVGMGLAAALLAELALYGRIAIDTGEIRVISRQPPPDAVAHSTLAQLLAQPQHRSARTWLAFLSATATDSVAQRLMLAGLWRQRKHRRLGRTGVSFQPADVNAVAGRSVRLARLLRAAAPIGEPDVMLAGLVMATGLLDTVLWQQELRDAGVARLRSLVHQLPPPLSQLLAVAETAIGDAILMPR